MTKPQPHACYYCQSTAAELRPYGPHGALVCYPCGTAPPHEPDARRQFTQALTRSAAKHGVAVLTKRGVR